MCAASLLSAFAGGGLGCYNPQKTHTAAIMLARQQLLDTGSHTGPSILMPREGVAVSLQLERRCYRGNSLTEKPL